MNGLDLSSSLFLLLIEDPKAKIIRIMHLPLKYHTTRLRRLKCPRPRRYGGAELGFGAARQESLVLASCSASPRLLLSAARRRLLPSPPRIKERQESLVLAAFPGLTRTAKEELEWVKNEYSAREQMVFGKIKEGVIMAIEHPGIAVGSATAAGIVLFKRPRSYLIQRVRCIFVSKETLLSGIQAEVNHMRQTVNLVSNESQKLMDRAATAEKRFQKGWNTLREEGRAIQSELNQISDIEKQAVGLKGILDQLPRAHASEFRSEEGVSVIQSTPENFRKVIVATDIAETNITIDDVIYVVDTGKLKAQGEPL